MRLPKIDTKIVAIIFSVIFLFLTLFYIGGTLGLDAAVATDFLQIVPGLSIFAVGLVILSRLRGIFFLPGFGTLGIGVAVLAEEMHTLGIINDAMIHNLAIGEFQLLVIVLSFILGAILMVSIK